MLCIGSMHAYAPAPMCILSSFCFAILKPMHIISEVKGISHNKIHYVCYTYRVENMNIPTGGHSSVKVCCFLLLA